MAEHVQENLCKDQKHQKSWYDGNAQKGSFQPGDQVLILLPVPPTSTGTVAGPQKL